jgi:hypothetical protein
MSEDPTSAKKIIRDNPVRSPEALADEREAPRAALGGPGGVAHDRVPVLTGLEALVIAQGRRLRVRSCSDARRGAPAGLR